MLIFIYFVTLYVVGANAVIYDTYTGKPATQRQLRLYQERNNAQLCSVDVQPCDPEEWKRVDGTCNNLRHPSFGAAITPTSRYLPAVLDPNYEPRKTEAGENFPLARNVRWQMLREGKASDLRTTQLISYYLLFMISDVNSLHDIFNAIRDILYCCEPEGKNDYMCTPLKIPVDDPVHRFSGVRCMNLTRPESLQIHGCLENGTSFVRMSYATPVFDLSQIYAVSPGNIEHLREFEDGLLKIEEDHGKLFPPSQPENNDCFLNEPPRETRCHRYQLSTGIGPNFFIIQFYRYHNYIAQELKLLNPCWDDERLFYTARDINIAVSMQLYYYEMLPLLLGRENMVRDGIISYSDGFRDIYDENISPQILDEFPYAMRWFHTIQETNMKFYDNDGNFLKNFPMVNLTARTGLLPLDETMEKVTQGSFRQLGAAFDFTIDIDMAERVFGGIDHASDVASSDIAKGRLFGLQSYIKYREFCTRRSYKSFGDLRDAISTERIHRLKEVYSDVKDVELMPALWAEKRVRGGRVPETVYCLFAEQLLRTIASDRHWYERPNRPHAFSLEQLEAVRQTTMAGVLCAVGDSVTQIQPSAFSSISKHNPLTDCSSDEIGKLDLSPWKDPECSE